MPGMLTQPVYCFCWPKAVLHTPFGSLYEMVMLLSAGDRTTVKFRDFVSESGNWAKHRVDNATRKAAGRTSIMGTATLGPVFLLLPESGSCHMRCVMIIQLQFIDSWPIQKHGNKSQTCNPRTTLGTSANASNQARECREPKRCGTLSKECCRPRNCTVNESKEEPK